MTKRERRKRVICGLTVVPFLLHIVFIWNIFPLGFR